MDQQTSSTYDRILNAAAHLFAQKGYDGTTTREIVKEADSSLSSFQTHFQSKETVYKEAVNRAMVRYDNMLKPCLREMDMLEQKGMLHGEAAWNLLSQLVVTHAEWVFMEEERDTILLMNREMLDTQPMMNTVPDSARTIMAAVRKLCESYVGTSDTTWAKVLGHTIVMTLFSYTNYPRVLSQITGMDVTLSENTLHLKCLAKGYILTSLRAYLDARKQDALSES